MSAFAAVPAGAATAFAFCGVARARETSRAEALVLYVFDAFKPAAAGVSAVTGGEIEIAELDGRIKRARVQAVVDSVSLGMDALRNLGLPVDGPYKPDHYRY